VHDVPSVKPRNRVLKLFTNPELTNSELETIERDNGGHSADRYRLVINCTAEKTDKKVSGRITLGC